MLGEARASVCTVAHADLGSSGTGTRICPEFAPGKSPRPGQPVFLRRAMPSAPSPASIMSQVDGSGTSVMKPRISPAG